MNKQALSSLSVEQLRQCRQTLAKRIDDLKFFNLDLGRTNISLSEEYRELRQKADKVKQGKIPKINKAKSYRKNIYLQHEPKPQQLDNHLQYNQIDKKVNPNNFNFNDLYKLGKNKISSWIGGKGKRHEEIQIPNEHYHQNYSYQSPHQPQALYCQQVIIGDFPPAQVMKADSSVQSDPSEQEVTFVVRQLPVIKPISQADHQKDPIEQEITQIIRQSHTHQQPLPQQSQPNQLNQPQHEHYQRLYKPLQNNRFIYEEQQQQIYERQRYMMGQHHQANSSHAEKEFYRPEEPQSRVQGKNPTMKSFQFDDLPGLGWKKLKGLIGWGTKNKKIQQSKPYHAPIHQQQAPYLDQNSNLAQNQPQLPPTINVGQPVQRKRTPIFGPGISSLQKEDQQQDGGLWMKQARIQKQVEREYREETSKEQKIPASNTQKADQLEAESRIQEGSEVEQKEKVNKKLNE